MPCFAAFQNQTYPFESMVSDLKLERDPSRNPVFGAMLSYNTFDVSSIELKGLKTKVARVNQPISKFDITLEVYDKSTTLFCEFEYATKLFKKSTIRAMSLHFKNMLKVVFDNPEIRIGKIDLLSLEEKKKILYDFNANTAASEKEMSLIRLFEHSVAQYPRKTALIFGGRRMTYEQIDRCADSYAAQLAARGVGRNDIVGICATKSFGLMCAILGTLKAGAAFLPVDPLYPEERREFMLKDSGARVLITDHPKGQSFAGSIVELKKTEKGEYPKTSYKHNGISRPDDLAYVIYTSGSTGKPKGVMLTVRGVMNLYEIIRRDRLYGKDSIVATTASISFDMFVSDALMPLMYGASVLLCTEEESRQPHLLAKTMRDAGANSMQATPSRMQMMMEDKSFRSVMADLVLVINGGESFPPEHLRKMKRLTRARILNIYGPTETTIYSSIKDLTHASRVTIGRAASNLQYYILDSALNPVPVGVPGELYIGGKSVARGYINREKLTKEHFLKNPFADGEMYKTGDICAFLTNGEAVSLGRSDFQVKIRGLRIELGEIENEISKCKGIENAVVMAYGEGMERRLCAYYTKKTEVDVAAIRQTLQKKLPVYMIPSCFVALKQFPITSAGKVDRKALPEPSETSAVKKTVRGTPATDTQKKMAKIWKRVLKATSIGPKDNFFELGGDSLAVIQVQTAIFKYGFEIGTQDFYELQTLEAVCARIDKKLEVDKKPITDIERFALSLKNVRIPLTDAESRPAGLSCVLLTGANGYLGAHVLAELSGLYNSHVYCIMRANNAEEALRKLENSLVFYFGEGGAEKRLENVQVLCGDIALPGMGIDKALRDELAGRVETVIHCAALTSHYGMSEAFERTNVIGTENVADFCLKERKKMLHVSTMSVAGDRLDGNPAATVDFDETAYYIGQEYDDNEYKKSKFLAEGMLLRMRKEGLSVRIFRVGNLTPRLSDGRYQANPAANAFAGRLKSFIEIGAVPETVAGLSLEFTPVDLCAKAMLILSQSGGKNPLIFHLYNPYKIAVEEWIKKLPEELHKPEIVSDRRFIEKLRALSLENGQKKLTSIVNEINKLDSTAQTIRTRSDRTVETLRRAGFVWAEVSGDYIVEFIKTIYRS